MSDTKPISREDIELCMHDIFCSLAWLDNRRRALLSDDLKELKSAAAIANRIVRETDSADS